MKEGRNQIFNITRGEGRTLSELARIISDLVPDTQVIESKHDENRPKRGSLDISKARYRDWETDRKSTRLNSSHRSLARMPSSA